jgi:hypothetical protein
MADESVTDPLRHYTREELISLIERLAEENQTLRDQADHFERLYLDIIHSTSWKLAWPIRAGFKVLQKGRSLLSRSRRPTAQNLPSGSPETVSSGSKATQPAAATSLACFCSSSASLRLNLLISRHPGPATLEAVLLPLARLASARTLPLRIICLDPQLTARDCLQVLKQKPEAADLDFVFYTQDLATIARSPFRLDMGAREIILSLSETADRALATVVPPAARLIIDAPQETRWENTLLSMLSKWQGEPV